MGLTTADKLDDGKRESIHELVTAAETFTMASILSFGNPKESTALSAIIAATAIVSAVMHKDKADCEGVANACLQTFRKTFDVFLALPDEERLSVGKAIVARAMSGAVTIVGAGQLNDEEKATIEAMTQSRTATKN